MIQSPNLKDNQIELPILRWEGDHVSSIVDDLIIETPVEIKLLSNSGKIEDVSVTMCSPSDLEEMALGFLFNEGIINGIEQVKNVIISEENEKTVILELKDDFKPSIKPSERNFISNSSCGMCGKNSIDEIYSKSIFEDSLKSEVEIDHEILYTLPEKLFSYQSGFKSTGGVHASGLFSTKGELLMIKEDVGRHNALDKLIGAALKDDSLPLDQNILLLSGRISFELVQKANMAGIQIISGIGAPSDLAVKIAREKKIALVGFLKNGRMNCYSLPEHIQIL